MANIKQARKRARQAEKSRELNMAHRSRLRTFMKKTLKAIQTGDKDKATAAYQETVPVIDKMANKGLIHKNKAARHKSRLNARIRAL